MSDLTIQALGLLEFIEQSLQEGIQRPATLKECLSEADGALRILTKLVQRDGLLHASFAVSPISNLRFSDIAEYSVASDRDAALRRSLEFVDATKALFG